MLLRFLTIYLLTISYVIYADNSINPSPNDNTILVLGDSLSAAYGIELEKGWVNLLRNKLSQQNKNSHWQVINASISGDTTAGGYERLPNLIQQHSPVLCIIALGANDGLRGLSLRAMQLNLQAMTDECNETGDTLLIGMKLPPNYGEKYASAFHQVYANIASQNNIHYIPFMLEDIALENKYFQTDQLHPTSDAQSIILNTIWNTLENIITSFN